MEFPLSILQKCWFLAGPTASGKSATALILAEKLGAEIVSLDSMAIYRGMDIGTAKPSRLDRDQIAHHLIDIADPHEEFSVADFVQRAATASQEIEQRGRTPLFVGGTGLYLRSILRGIFDGPEANRELRTHLEQSAVQNGPEWLHDRLAACDPATASRLHQNDLRRIIRALEVFELTGRPLSESQQHTPRLTNERPQAVIWLEPPRDWLRTRIAFRVDQMMSAGWLSETEWLHSLHPPASRTACQAIGYRELIEYIRGNITLTSAVEQIKISTRQFAKRQHTWFRNLEECRSLPINGEESPEALAERILRLPQKY